MPLCCPNTLLRLGILQDSRPLPRWRSLLSSQRFVLVLLLHFSGPGLFRALCAVVQTLPQGYRDCHPFMPQHGTEASLCPAAGTSCAAACSAFDFHHTNRQDKRTGSTKGSATCLNLVVGGSGEVVGVGGE